MRVFEPWIGTQYRTTGLDGLRVLVLGESHYGAPAAPGSFRPGRDQGVQKGSVAEDCPW